jgi:hypothetical protein
MLSELEIQEIKARHPLKEFLELRGLEFSKPSQGAFACTCPFHEEKTASFRVYPDHHFYCYGCGKVGDIFTILKDLDGLEFKDAVDRLNSTSPLTSAIRKATAPAKPDAVSIPLPESRLARWNASCERLAADPRQIERIASWRGLSKEIVVNAARAHLMGLWEYWGAIREAFLILAPGHCTRPVVEGVPPTYEPVPISIHVRLAPGSHGNQDGTKASWHYDPKSTQDTPVRSWPFIWGNLIGARWLFVLEGQWDGLALADACGWLTPESMPPGCVIVGLRGSTGSSRFLKDYPLDRKASAICIGDNDRAGNAWHDEGGFLDQ